MAVTKIWAIHDSISRVLDYCSNPEKTRLTDLEQVLIYAADTAKTLDEGEQSYAVTGVNCSAESAAKEMAATQQRFGKTGGNVAYHAYQSFKTGEVSATECHRIGLETARRLWGDNYQVLVATHFNTGTYHNHFVVNSVGMWDGRKMEAKFGVYYALRDMSDRICREHGLPVIEDPQRHKTARSLYFAEKNGEPTRYNLMRQAMDKALSLSGCWYEMETVLRKLGYQLDGNANRKYVTIRPIGSQKSTRTFRLGPAYEKEAMVERMVENQLDHRVMKNYYAFLRSYSPGYAEEHPPTEEYYRKREFYSKATQTTGYISLFRAIGILLGIEPLYQKVYETPISAECREASRRLDRYTAEITLVGQEHMDTVQDLQNFITKTNAEIDEVSAIRSEARNKQRNCTDPKRLANLKKLCSDCTTLLKNLRKRKVTALNILEDNPKLRELLKCEFETRLERDPYLSEREKRAIRQQGAPEREKHGYER
jgi:hypothetical protein